MNISLKQVSKQIDGQVLFTCESLSLYEGIYIFTGENACGKSSLFRMISQLDPDYTGDIYFDGNLLSKNNRFLLHNKLIAYQTQKNSLFLDLSFKENIDLILDTYNVEKLENLLNIFSINHIYNSKKILNKCSGGERQKVSLIINILKDTPVLLLDEVDNSLDKESIYNMVEYIRDEQDKCILIITHNLDFYESLEYKEVKYVDGIITFDEKVEANVNIEKDNEQFEVKETENLADEKFKNKVKLSRKLIDNSLALNFCLTVFTLFLMLYSIGGLMRTFAMLNPGTIEYSERSSLIQSPSENQLYYLYGDKSWFETTKYYFTDEDMQKLEDLDYVTKVVPMGVTGSEINSVAIEKDGLEYAINDGAQGNKFTFSNFVDPRIIRNNTGYNGLENGKIIFGTSPKDKSNEILLGERYAKEELKADNPKELVGKKVTIPVIDYYTNQKMEFQFKVSGIYQVPEENNNDPEQQIVAYNPESSSAKYNSCFLYGEQDISRCIISNTGEKDLKYVKEQNENDTLGKYPNFYVEVEHKGDLKKLTKDIKQYDKYSLVDNNYSRKYNNGFLFLKKTIYNQIFVFCMILLVYMIMLMLTNRLLKKKLIDLGEIFDIQGIDMQILKAAIRKNNLIIKVFSGLLSFVFSVWFIYYGIKQSIVIVILIVIMLIFILTINHFVLKRRENYV